MTWWDTALQWILGGADPKPPATALPRSRYVRQPVTIAGVTPTATLRLDTGSKYPGTWSQGGFTFTLPYKAPAPYGGTLRVTATGYVTTERRFTLQPVDPTRTTMDLPRITPTKVPAPSPTPPVPVEPPQQPSVPEPAPAPAPVKSPDAIVLSLATVASPDCPDVRDWPIGATVQSFELADRERFERGDTMIDFAGRDELPVAMGSQGAITYTLWMGCHIRGQWYILPIVECIRGYVPTGQLLSHGQLPQNLAYFATPPMRTYQPAPGEDVAFFATTGDTRRQNVQGIASPWRTNVIVVPFQVGTTTF